MELYRRLAKENAGAFTPDLAASLNNLGAMLGDLGHREKALEAAQEAVELYRRLAKENAGAFTPDLAASLNNLGNMLSALGRREKAIEATQEAVELRRRLPKEDAREYKSNQAGDTYFIYKADNMKVDQSKTVNIGDNAQDVKVSIEGDVTQTGDNQNLMTGEQKEQWELLAREMRALPNQPEDLKTVITQIEDALKHPERSKFDKIKQSLATLSLGADVVTKFGKFLGF